VGQAHQNAVLAMGLWLPTDICFENCYYQTMPGGTKTRQ